MSDYGVETLTKAFTELRDQRSELKKIFEEDDFKLKSKMEKIEARLMEKLQTFGVNSVKTPFGTVYTQIERRWSCQDWISYWAWCRDNDRLDCLEKRVSQGAMRILEEEGVELPPGLSFNAEKVVRVRRN